jgi:ribosomal protein L7/L12
LAEAKSAVDQLVAGLQSSPAAASPAGDELTAEILEAARNSGLIAAIKRYREAAGTGLKEAKDAVEALCRTHGVVPAGGSGCGGAVLVLVVVALGTVALVVQ